MYKNILRKVNFFIYLLIAIIIAILQSTIFSYFPLHYLQPDLLLILAVYFGFKREVIEGGAFIAIAALLLEAHSGTGKYFFLTTYLYAFLIAKLLSRMMVVPNFLSTIGIIAGLTILKKIGILVLLGMQGRTENGLKHFFIYLIPSLVVQALLSPLCFAWFHRLDLATHKLESSLGEFDG